MLVDAFFQPLRLPHDLELSSHDIDLRRQGGYFKEFTETECSGLPPFCDCPTVIGSAIHKSVLMSSISINHHNILGRKSLT